MQAAVFFSHPLRNSGRTGLCLFRQEAGSPDNSWQFQKSKICPQEFSTFGDTGPDRYTEPAKDVRLLFIFFACSKKMNKKKKHFLPAY